MDEPLGRVRLFLDNLIRDIGEIPAFFALPESEQEAHPLRIEAILVLDVDDELMRRVVDELQSALGLEVDDLS